MLYWNAHGMSGWGWLVMSLSTVLFLALLIGLRVLIFRSVDRGPADVRGRDAGASAERLLAERFASGESDEDEYRRRLAVLWAPTSGGTMASP